jgi:hypothetical protein
MAKKLVFNLPSEFTSSVSAQTFTGDGIGLYDLPIRWVAKSGDYTIAVNEGALADTSGAAWILTLPGSPNDGDTIGIADATGSFETHNLTIARNGSLIHGYAEDLICNLNDVSFNLVYTGAVTGWKIETYLSQGYDPNLLSTYVPYTGATTDVDLGTHYITAKNFSDTSHYTGFPNRTDTSLSWNDGTYTLTLTSSSKKIWINGVEYTIGNLTNQVTDATGLYWFWITAPAGVPQLNSSTSAPGFDKCLVAIVYWNTTTDKGIISDERHWMGRDKQMHEYLHETVGARWYTGGTLSPTNTTFSVTQCEMYDEDIEHILPVSTTCRIIYHNGSSAWEWDDGATYLYKLNGNKMRYNNGTALADCSNNDHLCMWLYATNNVTYPFMSVMGDSVSNLANARLKNPPSLAGIPSAEIKLLYKIIFKQNASSVTYIETSDYRVATSLSTSFTPTDHSVLSKLDFYSANHTGFQPKLDTEGYMEYTLNGSSQLTNVDYWDTAAKGTKLYTKTITWTGTNPTTVTFKDEIANKTMTTTLAYSGSTLTNVTKVLS